MEQPEQPSDIFDQIVASPNALVLMAGIVFATCGWLYAARRQRTTMRKQHTFNALMAATFENKYQDALDDCRQHLSAGVFPDLSDGQNEQLRKSVRFLMNHYEFLAAGIRNGDIHEKLLKDSERGTVVRLFETAENCGYVTTVRNRRKRQTIFEHLEWLYERWEERPVPWWQFAFEWLINRPLYYRQSRWILLVTLLCALGAGLTWAAMAHR